MNWRHELVAALMGQTPEKIKELEAMPSHDIPRGPDNLPDGVTMRDIDGGARVPCICTTKVCFGCDESKCPEHEDGGKCDECEEWFCGECEPECLAHYGDCRYLCDECRDRYR